VKTRKRGNIDAEGRGLSMRNIVTSRGDKRGMLLIYPRVRFLRLFIATLTLSLLYITVACEYFTQSRAAVSLYVARLVRKRDI